MLPGPLSPRKAARHRGGVGTEEKENAGTETHRHAHATVVTPSKDGAHSDVSWSSATWAALARGCQQLSSRSVCVGLHRSRFDVRVGKDRLTNESGVRLPSGIWPVFSPFLCICGPSGCRRREVQRLGRCPAGMGAPPETLAASSFLLPIFGAGSPPSRSQDSVLLVSQVGQMGKVVASVTDEGRPGLFWLETQSLPCQL